MTQPPGPPTQPPGPPMQPPGHAPMPPPGTPQAQMQPSPIVAPKKKRLKSIANLLGRRWWQGVAALLAVIGLAFTAVQITKDASSGTDSSSVTDSEISGDCNAQGHGNTVDCSSLPDQIGRVEISPNNQVGMFLFEGLPNQLPTPPDYTKDNNFMHCHVWERWLMETQNIYSLMPGGLVSAVGGAADQVSIIDYKVIPYSRRPLGKGPFTSIRCDHGGDANFGYYLYYDTMKREAHLRSFLPSDESEGPPMPMPPASVNLTGPEHAGIYLEITSSPNYLYEGRLVVTVIINGERKDIAVGSPDQPYRWLSNGSDYDPSHEWDWDPRRHKWIKDYQPPGE
jgi:hypothetical protein